MEGIEFVWLCKESHEVYPVLGSGDLYTANNHTIPEEKLSDISLGGCFGTGPGNNPYIIVISLFVLKDVAE